MDRRYPLEAQLLSRSHTKQRTIELLEERYALSSNGPFLPLVTPTSLSKKRQTLLATMRHAGDKRGTKRRNPANLVRSRLRTFIKKNKKLQSLYKFKKSDNLLKQMIKFDDYLKMNELWVGYVQDLLNINRWKEKGQVKVGSGLIPLKSMLQKLSALEFTGCFINVLNSSNESMVGKQGIIILDTMKFFIIVEDVDGGRLKMLMKEGSVFNFVVPLYNLDKDDVDGGKVLEFSIIGSRVCYRSDDRATRKFKTRASDDLGILIKD